MRALFLIGLAACQSGGTSNQTPPAPDALHVTARDPGGKVMLDLALTSGHCTGGGVDLAPTSADPLAGRYRVGGANGHIDLVDASGMPLAHFTIDTDAATVNGPNRSPVAKSTVSGDRVAVASPDGAALAYVTGTTDLEVAAMLTAPGVPDDVRATLACQKLLSK